ncbi:MAG: di-trans,poly-cis-decaprenylcistransferase [Chloroflexi bacterium]|nr:di-trans,poly-cis-decaprenylcistransferase [Chloroflexota bacterium]
MNFEPELPENPPYHVGIIMDGNGRWAKQRGLPRSEGHRHGVENLRGVLEACGDFGIKILTIYAFSTENWGRPPAEVRFLLSIIDYFIDRELNALHEKGVKLRHIGKLDGLNPRLKKRIQEALELTRNNEVLTLNIAFNYGGRDEIVQAVRQIMREGTAPEAVTEDLISQHLYTGGQPDPDLIIRTGGDMRLSNFLMWQAAYSEFYSTPTYWPDFNRTELLRAIEYYGARDRRFGLVKEP